MSVSPAPPEMSPGPDEPSGIGSDSGSAGAVLVAARAGPVTSARASAARPIAAAGRRAVGSAGDGRGRVLRRGGDGDPCLVGMRVTMAVGRRRTPAREGR